MTIKQLGVVDLVALACDMWECDPAKALERLDLPALEHVIEVSFGGDPSVTRAGGELVATLLAAGAAGPDTPQFALLVLLALATLNDHRLETDGATISTILSEVRAGKMTAAALASWLDAHLVPDGAGSALDSEPEAGSETASTEAAAEQAAAPGPPTDWPELGPIASETREAFALATQEARRMGQSHIGTTHLLLGLAAVPGSRAAVALEADGAPIGRLRNYANVIAGWGAATDDRPRRLTPLAAEVLRQARGDADVAAAQELTTEHVLRALLASPLGMATRLLARVTGRDLTSVVGDRSRVVSRSISGPGPRGFIRSLRDDVQDYILESVDEADVSSIDIGEHDGQFEITIHTATPGLIIGRQRAVADRLEQGIGRVLGPGSRVRLTIAEVRDRRIPVQVTTGGSCSFCGAHPEEGIRFVAVPRGRGICEACVEYAADLLRGADPT